MIGTRLGPYLIQSELGSGGMGKVYLAEVVSRHHAGLDLGTRVAVKVVHSHLLETEGFFKRFLREAEIGKHIRHTNVVRTFDVDATMHEGKQVNFIVLEYVEGQTLRAMMRDLERMPEELCVHFGREISRGLEVIHAAGIVHRDLKPENVLVTTSNTVKVMDLGIARVLDPSVRISKTGSFIGSVLYAAPEQFRAGGTAVDGRTDLYALGLILYELCTGAHPFGHDELRIVMQRQINDTPLPVGSINPQISPFFEEVLKSLLQKSPDARIASAKELLTILDERERSEWWSKRARDLRTSTDAPLRRIRMARETPMHGRDDTMAALRSAFEDVKAVRGQVVLLEGESGIGKTRIIDELVGGIMASGERVNFLFGAYLSGGAATALSAFSTAVREHFAGHDIERALKNYLDIAPSTVRAFASVIGGSQTTDEERQLTRDSLNTAFLGTLQGLSSERPTILLVDDIDFAPDDGRTLFAAIAAGIATHRVLMIGTLRPSVIDAWTAGLERACGAKRLRMGRLAASQVRSILVDALRSEALVDELERKIIAKSEGNPYVVFEIMRCLREGGYIKPDSRGVWVRTRPIRDIPIPSTVTDVIGARLVGLGEEDREALELASCCGYDFDPLMVAEAMSSEHLPLLKRLGRIEKHHRIVRSSGRRFAFESRQIRDVIYQSTSELIRERYHALLGDALERATGPISPSANGIDGRAAFDICNHFLASSRPERCRDYVKPAVEHLTRSQCPDDAIGLLDRALSVPGLFTGQDRIEIQLLWLDRLLAIGATAERHDEIVAVLREADSTGDSSVRAEVRNRVGWYLYGLGRFGEAETALAEGVELAQNAGNRHAESVAISNLGSVLWSTGRFVDARTNYERSLLIAREIGDPQAESRTTANLGGVAFALGGFSEARVHYERSLEIALAAGDVYGEARVTSYLGSVLYALGRYSDAHEWLERSRTLSRDYGYRQVLALSLLNAGWLEAEMGSNARSREMLLAARLSARELGDARLEGYALQLLGTVLRQMGSVHEAEEHLVNALEMVRSAKDNQAICEALVSLGALLLADHRPDAARERLLEAVRVGRECDVAYGAVLGAAYLASTEEQWITEALAICASNTERLIVSHRMEAEFLLWTATRDETHLSRSHGDLQFLLEHAPSDRVAVMELNVPLHHKIATAWRAARD